MNNVQIGTILYRDKEKIVTTQPIIIKASAVIQKEKQKLVDTACKFFVSNLLANKNFKNYKRSNL